jgi:hypothetical protein
VKFAHNRINEVYPKYKFFCTSGMADKADADGTMKKSVILEQSWATDYYS